MEVGYVSGYPGISPRRIVSIDDRRLLPATATYTHQSSGKDAMALPKLILPVWLAGLTAIYYYSMEQTTQALVVAPPSASRLGRQERLHPSPIISYLLMSTTSNNPDDESADDELSKLKSKRSEIKRRVKEEPAVRTTATELTVDLDLDKLPEFKTERPVRRSGQSPDPNISEPGGKQGDSRSSSSNEETNNNNNNNDAPIIDFQADYPDENDFHIPNRMGITTIAWGDPSRNFVADDKKLSQKRIRQGKFVPGDVQVAYEQLLAAGVTLVETAASHGAVSRSANRSAQDILRQCWLEQPPGLPECQVVLGGLGTATTTTTGSLWFRALKGGGLTNSIVNGMEDSLSRLGINLVDLYQAPAGTWFPSTLLCRGLVAAIESGQCNHVGVVGVTKTRTLRKIQRKLEDLGDVALTSNAFEFSLTNRRHEVMIAGCKACNVIPLILNPLDGGLASGVYTATNPSGGNQVSSGVHKFSFQQLEKLQPLHSVQESIAERVRTRVIRGMRDTQERFKSRYGPPPKINTDITTTQVALNYVIAKGGVPLAEVNSPAQAKEVLGCLGWSLLDTEVDMLDAAAALCKL
jgi:aryl-alcohol dehydrogenase-like predicted oxidoreductase